jgi:geranylgeranyl diphosphate synthase type I
MTVTLETLRHSQDLVQPALRAAVDRLDPDTRTVVAYHLGWVDRFGHPTHASGGKALRPGLTLLAAAAAGGGREQAVPGAVAVELVHNFSLVHDDVMDRDAERRHRPTVWAVWGDATAVLAGDAMLSLAHEVLLDSDSPHAVAADAVVARATRELIRGQVQDLAFEQRRDVDLAECLDMAAGKTGSLLSASAAVGALLAGGDPTVVDALAAYGSQLGLAFQLVDDLLGIWGEPTVTGKPVCSDLRSGKKSLPITWAIQHGGAAGRALARRLVDAEHLDERGLRTAADLVDRAGGRAWAEGEARRRLLLAAEALDRVPLDPACRAELLALAEYVVERSS